ncbi:MAG: nuclear transport factor 2 family protein [Bacteroidota bacterium]
MDSKLIIIACIALLSLITSCQKRVDNPKNDVAELIKQVEQRVHEFHKADTSLNAEGVVDLLWPEFTMLVDGNRIAYQDVKTGTKAYMASLNTFHTEWKDLKIIPVGNRCAISSFIFSDSIVSKDGTVTKSNGPNTFVWEKRDDEWKVIYGDADHYK